MTDVQESIIEAYRRAMVIGYMVGLLVGAALVGFVWVCVDVIQ